MEKGDLQRFSRSAPIAHSRTAAAAVVAGCEIQALSLSHLSWPAASSARWRRARAPAPAARHLHPRVTAALGGGGTLRCSDPAEIAGRRVGLARLLDRHAVADLAKIASSLLRGGRAWP